METIKNYLESMFRGLPQTEKIMRAKSELLQMMEDKYTELIKSGKSENEAIGAVIQDFGNLEELADDLGIKDILFQTKQSGIQRRKLSFDEVSEYLVVKKKSILMHAIAVLLFIISVTGSIITDGLALNDIIGVTAMFLSIGIGVILIILSRSCLENWRYINTEPCSIDAVSIDYLKNHLRDFTPSYSVLSSLGILLCILSFIPAAVMDDMDLRFSDDFGAVILFCFVGAGVFMIVYARMVKKTYLKLLALNEKVVFDEKDDKAYFKTDNTLLNAILRAYWLIVTCVYLCISFFTFAWGITWIIWPVASAIFIIIKAIFTTRNDKEKI